MNHELLSVIVPVYNAEKYLSRCIDSILNQTYTSLEIILVDDGSVDSSGEICCSYKEKDSRVRVFRQENQGVAVARKVGTQLALGKYLAFADSDDYIDSDLYEQLVSHMKSAELVTSGYYEGEKHIFDKIMPGLYETEEQMEYLYGNMIYLQESNTRGLTSYVWNKIFLTKLAKEVFKEVSDEVFVGEDSEFLYRYVLKCKSCHITRICGYHYEANEGSIIHSTNYDFLYSVTALYKSLEKDFRKSSYKEILMPQLEKWILSLSDATYEFFGFEKPKRIQYILYINPFINKLPGKKIVLYGAGVIGKSYQELYERIQDAQVVLWVDKAWKEYQKKGLMIYSAEQIRKTEYDYIIIAVKKEAIALEIRKELLAMDIVEERIKWEALISTIL